MQLETTSVSGNTFKNITQGCVDFLLKQGEYTPKILDFIEESLRKSYDAYQEIVDVKGFRKKAEEGTDISKEELEIPVDDFGELIQLENTSKAYSFVATRLLETSFLDSIVSFDVFMMNLFRSLYELFPDTLNSSQITYKDLLSVQSIEQARSKLIDDKIDELFRKSHQEQIETLEKQFKINAKSDCDELYKAFIEITERRNVLIHCDGIASRQYESICRETGIQDVPSIGTKLTVDRAYFDKACGSLLAYSIMIGYGTWRVKEKSNATSADEYLLDICNLLCEYGRYGVLIDIINFVTCKIKPQPKRLIIHQLKLFQIFAFKQLGDEKAIEGLMAAEDWTSVDITIKFQKLVVLQQYEDAFKLMKSIDADVFFNSNSELFRDFIKTEKFHETFQSVYGRDFKLSRRYLNG